MITAVDYAPPRWLRNPHLQSALSASELRRRRALRRLHALGAVSEAHIFDGGDGIRLQGWHTRLPGMSVRGLALLLHGWEGSAESSYMRAAAASLLEAGYEVVRLNFRDHGDTHHLNEGIFHSCRIAEVVNATADIARRFPHERMVAAGYSLGGNFALRLALRAPQAGIQLDRVAAVCPVLDPSLTMASMETEHPLYCWYFRRKWRDSLRRKRALFPRSHDFSERDLGLGMRELTRWMVERYTDFGTLENYFEGYSIAGERLLPLQVPAHILMVKDDPVIPFTPFGQWQLPERATLEVAGWGGHCGFIENVAGDGYSERWVAQRLARQD